MRHALTAGLLAALWLLWSGHWDLGASTDRLLLGYGVFSVGLVTWIRARMATVVGDEDVWPLGLRWVPYVPWLLVEIVKSNAHVVARILSPNPGLQPQLVRVKGAQKTDIGRAVYANSITLTPGTITLDIREGEFLVHALTDATAEGLREGTMDRKCAAMERP